MLKKVINSPAFNMILLILITFFVFRLSLNQDLDKTILILRHTRWGWISLAVLAIFLMYAAWGYAMKTYTKLVGADIFWHQGLNISLVGAFGSGITPSATGGQIFQAVAFRRMKVSYSKSVSVLWIDFLLYQVVMIVLVLGLLILKLQHYLNISGLFSLVIIGFILNLAVLLLLIVLARSARLHDWIATRGIQWLHKIKLVRNPEATLTRIQLGSEQFQSSIQLLVGSKRTIFIGILMNIIRLLLFFFLPFLIAKALRAPVQMKDIYDIIALSSFVMMISVFIPLPGASGGTELTFMNMFSTVIQEAFLLPIMLIWRFLSYYLVIIIGAVIFFYYKRKAV